MDAFSKAHALEKALPLPSIKSFPHSSVGKESACHAADMGLIPGMGISPGEASGTPLRYSSLGNPTGRVGKTRDLFKKTRDTKGTFHAKMGSIKDRNSMDLTEAEDIKKRWQEYTEELYKKDLRNPDNHDGVITHLEPDILECEVKWALESITTN